MLLTFEVFSKATGQVLPKSKIQYHSNGQMINTSSHANSLIESQYAGLISRHLNKFVKKNCKGYSIKKCMRGEDPPLKKPSGWREGWAVRGQLSEGGLPLCALFNGITLRE